MSVKADFAAISLTPAAKAAFAIRGVDHNGLTGLIHGHITELKILLNEFAKIHPQSGGDAANYTALQTLLTTLA